jgi:hypothetical protein
MHSRSGIQQKVNNTPPNGESGRETHGKQLDSLFRHASFTRHQADGKDECRAAA